MDKNYLTIWTKTTSRLGQMYVRIIRNGLGGNSTVKWWSSMARLWQVSFSEWECDAKKENRKSLFGQYSPFLRAVFLFASYYYCKRIWQTYNIATVKNCLDITTLNSIFGLCKEGALAFYRKNNHKYLRKYLRYF